MILSHAHKFIFVKTNKTAGTSVEIALSQHCGPDDVITPVSPRDEETRRDMGFPGAQNHQGPEVTRWRWFRRHKVLSRRYFNHMPASAIRAEAGETVWADYFTFCIERNPWDRAVSAYFWKIRDREARPVGDWLRSDGLDLLKRKGRDLYMIDGAIAVDRVLRFEDLGGELEKVRVERGMPTPLTLPRAKSGIRPKSAHYRDVLDAEARDLIAREFAFEIETFGYEF